MTTETPLQAAAKKSNTTLTILTGLGLLALVILAVLAFGPLYNMLAGPFPIEANALADYTKPNESLKRRVLVQPERILDTGYRYTSESNGRTTTESAYHVMEIDDKYLLMKYPGDQTGDTVPTEPVEGALVALSKMEREQVYDSILEEEPSLQGSLMPFLFDASPYGKDLWVWIVALVVLAGLSMLGLYKIFDRSRGQLNHPIYKNLARYGDPVAVSNHLDQELVAPHEVIEKHYNFTPNWFAFLNGGAFDAIPYQDLLWYYQHTLTRKRYGITVGHTYSLMLGDRQGKLHNLMVSTRSEEPVHALMEALNRYAPWAIRGYSPELEKAFKKERESLTAEVDRAYAEHQRQS